jgi:hypothetical protein
MQRTGRGRRAADSKQGVGESGRPRLPWKQETGGSNPPTLTISYLSHISLPEKGVARRGGGNAAGAIGIAALKPRRWKKATGAVEPNADLKKPSPLRRAANPRSPSTPQIFSKEAAPAINTIAETVEVKSGRQRW